MTKLTSPDYVVPETVDATLVSILSWPRPHGSPAEGLFCQWLSERIHGLLGVWPARLSEDCLFVMVHSTTSAAPSTTLFSCHVDTVDNPKDGELVEGKVVQKMLTYDPNFGYIGLDPQSVAGCLGADDGAGIWLMLEMIKAKVPGGYIFHRGEERGGIGANAVLRGHIELLRKYELAIAFDRPNDSEVITHQGGQECASQKLGKALAGALNMYGLDYETSNRGVFTDTKVYRKVIPECINLGVGYSSQHSRQETQNYAMLTTLLAALLQINWDSLPIDRDPSKPDFEFEPKGRYFPAYKGAGGYPAQKSLQFPSQKGIPYLGEIKAKSKAKAGKTKSAYESLRDSSIGDLIEWLTYQPEEGAQSLVELMLEIGRLRSDVRLLTRLLKEETDV